MKPAPLHPGDTIGVVAPASPPRDMARLEAGLAYLRGLGYRVEVGRADLAPHGYLCGTDAARLAELNAFLRRDDVKALFCVRGGYGTLRLLPHLDYEAARRHAKLLVGYSDITALLLAVYARAGLVTFHGPVGISTWNAFSVDAFRRVLFDGEAVVMRNPQGPDGALVQTDDRVQTLTPGTARGRLAGGNLSVLAALVGTPYLPAWDGHVLFLEDTGEEIYRVDRMLTQLRLAGVLDRLAAFVFGKCTGCDPGEGYGSLTLTEVLADHVGPLGIPAWYGAMIGHIARKHTVPLGVEAEVDAGRGTIRLLEPAVA